jgi:hypothetical protein
MSVTPGQAADRLRELASTGELASWCRDVGVVLLVAFGSAIDPDRAATARDLDVAVLLDPDGQSDLLAVVNALVDLLHCDRVDVLDLARAGVVAQEQALVGTLPLFEQVPGTLAAVRDRAIVRRMDTDWLRRLDLELMAEA